MAKKLVLLVLLALGVALAVPSSRERIVTPISDRIKVQLVPGRLQFIAGQIEQGIRRGDGVPTSREWPTWLENSSASSTTDPWGNMYYIEAGREQFVVGSMGPDGQRGTADDLRESRPYARR